MNSISTAWAAGAALDIFTKPYRVKSRKDPQVWELAEKLFLTSDEGKLAGFCWRPKSPSGKKLLIIHGFAGNSRAFDRYIKPALAKGYEVYAYDAPAHGSSDGKRLNASIYMNAITQVIRHHGHFDAYLAHSLGGLCLMLALHQLDYNAAPKIVLIAPATESTTAADHFFRFLRLPKKMRNAFERKVEDLGGVPLQWYSISRILHDVKGSILWLHDEDDHTTPIADVYPLVHQEPGHVHFHFTKGLGHSRIYKDTGVKKIILDFLNA
jgi:pimeloyl-ACP methyl ester carboxylesterase